MRPLGRRPGIHSLQWWLWIPGSREDARPGMTVWMDMRVKPAYDAARVAAPCARFPDFDFKQPSAVVLAPPRELGFWFFSLSKREGGGTPKGALGNGRGLFPGSPENRSTRQRLSALHRGDLLAPVRASGDVAALGARARRFRAARLSPSSQLQWQTLLMGPDGNPKPPECAEHRLLRARRRRIPPRATSVPGNAPQVERD